MNLSEIIRINKPRTKTTKNSRNQNSRLKRDEQKRHHLKQSFPRSNKNLQFLGDIKSKSPEIHAISIPIDIIWKRNQNQTQEQLETYPTQTPKTKVIRRKSYKKANTIIPKTYGTCERRKQGRPLLLAKDCQNDLVIGMVGRAIKVYL